MGILSNLPEQTKSSHRPLPEAVDLRSSSAGLRTVAIFETVKGIVVLALGLGLLSFLHKDVDDAVENALIHLHLNPEHRIGQAIIHAASKMTDGRLWALAAGAAAYSVVRFVEAYGLWHRRVWAEWFALLSGMLYLPLEIYKLSEKTTWMHLLIFSVNLAIVLYMLEIRVRASRPLK